jgi:hypothetical protein
MINDLLKKCQLLAIGLLLSGCTSVQTISDLNYSLIDIQKGISATVPKGIAKISENRRTFSSKYFDPETIDADRSTERSEDVYRERASVVTTILGDRRPYTVEVDVLLEEDQSGIEPKKDDDYIEGKFAVSGHDKELARYFRDRLANYLARLERNKNLIDDFRPF